jgi:hypothetical protein
MAARGRDLLQCLADVPAYSPVDFEDRALILRRRPLRPLQATTHTSTDVEIGLRTGLPAR